MLFNSLYFVFLFLPVSLIGWYILNKLNLGRLKVACLCFVSLWFYGYANIKYLLILIPSLLINFLISFLFEKIHGKLKKIIFTLAMVLNIVLLGYFKYRNFFVETINDIFGQNFNARQIILPLAISFFTLQQIAFLTDRYKEEAPHYDFLTYSAFVLYFPKLISGPIVYHNEVCPYFDGTQKIIFDKEGFTKGLIRFMLGLSKKILIADLLSLYVEYGMARLTYFDTPAAWLWALLYALQLYFDFSGYTDMAIGISNMFGINLPENFDSPYKAVSVRDFWRRWHITLTRFLTKYIYIPLGGNRKGALLKIVNTVIVFLISGLWHGASWTFVIWGLLHAVAILISGAVHKKNKTKGNILSHVVTMVFVVFAWAVFRADTFENLRIILQKMFIPEINGFAKELCTAIYDIPELYMITKLLNLKASGLIMPMYYLLTVAFVVISIILMAFGDVRVRLNKRIQKGFSLGYLIFISILFVWALVSMSNVTTFLYFTF